MLDIDQDALGKAGRPVVHTPDYDVWLRPLADGSWAVALFNRTWEECEIAADFAALGLPASCTVRDVWAQKDLGVFKGCFATSIPGHAALLYRLRSAAVSSTHSNASAGTVELLGDKGDNVWTPDPNGPHARMVDKWPRTRVAALIDDLMVKQREEALEIFVRLPCRVAV